MRYQTLEQAFLEPQKGGQRPDKVYEVEYDVGRFFTPSYVDALNFQPESEYGTYKIIRTHNRAAP